MFRTSELGALLRKLFLLVGVLTYPLGVTAASTSEAVPGELESRSFGGITFEQFVQIGILAAEVENDADLKLLTRRIRAFQNRLTKNSFELDIERDGNKIVATVRMIFAKSGVNLSRDEAIESFVPSPAAPLLRGALRRVRAYQASAGLPHSVRLNPVKKIQVAIGRQRIATLLSADKNRPYLEIAFAFKAIPDKMALLTHVAPRTEASAKRMIGDVFLMRTTVGGKPLASSEEVKIRDSWRGVFSGCYEVSF